jgi:hypothetical protein
VQPSWVLRGCAHVSIDGERIDRALLHRVRPKPGRTVTIATVPRFGGGKKNPLRFLLQLAVAAASFIVPALLPLAGVTLFGGLVSASSLVGAAIFGIGSLLVNAFIPAQAPKLKELNGTAGRDSPALAIQGIRNQANPYGVVPRLYGKLRITPYFGAKTFTEIRGKDTWLRCLFDLGHGPLKLSDFRIGQTAIDAFEDVRYEAREGWPDDPPLTLYTRVPEEEPLSIKLATGDWAQRTTEPDADEISIDITFPTGLAAFDTSGDQQPLTVQLDIEYRTRDTGGGPGPWIPVTQPAAFGARLTTTLARPQASQGIGKHNEGQSVHTTRTYRVSLDEVTGRIALVSGSATVGNPSKHKPVARVAVSSNPAVAYQLTDERGAEFTGPGYFAPALVGDKVQVGAGTITPPAFTATDNSTAAVRRNKAFKVERGQYDVRVKRVTFESTDPTVFHQSFWTALRSFTDEAPVQAKGHALVALEIRATDQLNGIVDQFNCIAEAILWDYDAQSDSWIERTTSNAAAAYRDILMGSANQRPVGGSRLHWAELEAWAVESRAAGREFNAYLDFRQSAFEALRLVAGAARADFAMRDGKYSVVRDTLQSVPAQHITPRNSWGFRWRREFPDMPHAFRIAFRNREKDWLLDERIVPFDGWTELTATKFTDLEFIGITDPAQIFLEARYRQADAKLRATTYWGNLDFEHLVARHGSLVKVTHDVILVGIKAGRIRTLTLDGANNVLGFASDELLPMEPGKSYGVSIRTHLDCKVTRPLQLSVGENSSVTFATPISAAEAAAVGLEAAEMHRDRTLFGFGELGNETIECLVKRVVAGPDFTARLELKPYNPAVLAADAQPIPAFTSRITLPSQFDFRAPEAPQVESVRSDEAVLARQPDGSFESRIQLVLARKATARPPAARLTVRFRRTDAPQGAWSAMAPFPGDATIVWAAPVDDGVTYDVQLQAEAADGSRSDWTPLNAHRVVGKSTPPPDVPELAVEGFAGGRRLVWPYPGPPRDFAGFRVKHQTGESRNWDSAAAAHEHLVTENLFPIDGFSGTRTFLVKAVDAAGNESANAAAAVVGLGDPEIGNIVKDRDYKAEGWPGVLTNGTVFGGNLRAADTGTLFWTGLPASLFWTGNPNAVFWSAVYLEMRYTATFTPDLGDLPARLRLRSSVAAQVTWRLDYRQLGSAAPFWSGVAAQPFWSADAALFWQADPAFMPFPGDIDAQAVAYEFRIVTDGGTVQGEVTQFTIELDVADDEETIDNFVLPAAGARLPLSKSWREIHNVQITLEDDGGAAVTARWLDKETFGPLVRAFDIANAGAAGRIDARVVGVPKGAML